MGVLFQLQSGLQRLTPHSLLGPGINLTNAAFPVPCMKTKCQEACLTACPAQPAVGASGGL